VCPQADLHADGQGLVPVPGLPPVQGREARLAQLRFDPRHRLGQRPAVNGDLPAERPAADVQQQRPLAQPIGERAEPGARARRVCAVRASGRQQADQQADRLLVRHLFDPQECCADRKAARAVEARGIARGHQPRAVGRSEERLDVRGLEYVVQDQQAVAMG